MALPPFPVAADVKCKNNILFRHVAQFGHRNGSYTFTRNQLQDCLLGVGCPNCGIVRKQGSTFMASAAKPRYSVDLAERPPSYPLKLFYCGNLAEATGRTERKLLL